MNSRLNRRTLLHWAATMPLAHTLVVRAGGPVSLTQTTRELLVL